MTRPRPRPRRGPSLKDLLLWTFRRSERDVVRMYDYLSDMMRLAAGGSMLNFGCADSAGGAAAAGGYTPAGAQSALCAEFAGLARLGPGQVVVDVGSGYGSPAAAWHDEHGPSRIVCVNTSLGQLRGSERRPAADRMNASAAGLPLRDGSADRVLAFESAQHFRPLSAFAGEARRVLRPGGILALALPVMARGGAAETARLGLLALTWSSEHYSANAVLSALGDGFTVSERRMIGGRVYGPLADYYEANRAAMRERILQRYPGYVEGILHKSLARMKAVSDGGVIDYMMVACERGRD